MGEIFKSDMSEYYLAKDIFVGAKVTSHKKSIQECSTDCTCTYENFSEHLKKLGLVEHEIATLGRKYAKRIAKPASIDYAIAVAQEQLRKKIFEDFHRLD